MWEYYTISLPIDAGLEDELNELGKQGWELVIVNQLPTGGLFEKRRVFIFKRRSTSGNAS
jgi:hypothetical protein